MRHIFRMLARCKSSHHDTNSTVNKTNRKNDAMNRAGYGPERRNCVWRYQRHDWHCIRFDRSNEWQKLSNSITTNRAQFATRFSKSINQIINILTINSPILSKHQSQQNLPLQPIWLQNLFLKLRHTLNLSTPLNQLL